MAITWTSVTAPSQKSAVNFAALGADQIQQGITGLADLASNIAQKEIEDRQRVKDINNETVLNVINSIGNEDDLTNAKSQLNLDNLNKLYGNQINAGEVLSALNQRQLDIRNNALNDQSFKINEYKLRDQQQDQLEQDRLAQARQLALGGDLTGAYDLGKYFRNPDDLNNVVRGIEHKEDVQRIESALARQDTNEAIKVLENNPNLPNAGKYGSLISQLRTDALNRSSTSQAMELRKAEHDLRMKEIERAETARVRAEDITRLINNTSLVITDKNYEQKMKDVHESLAGLNAKPEEYNYVYNALNAALLQKDSVNPIDVRKTEAGIKFQQAQLDGAMKAKAAEIEAFKKSNLSVDVRQAQEIYKSMADVTSAIRASSPTDTVITPSALEDVEYGDSDIGGMDAVLFADRLSTVKLVAVEDANGGVRFRPEKSTDSADTPRYPVEPWMIGMGFQYARDTPTDGGFNDTEYRPDIVLQTVGRIAQEHVQQKAITDSKLAIMNREYYDMQTQYNALSVSDPTRMKPVGAKEVDNLLEILKKGASGIGNWLGGK